MGCFRSVRCSTLALAQAEDLPESSPMLASKVCTWSPLGLDCRSTAPKTVSCLSSGCLAVPGHELLQNSSHWEWEAVSITPNHRPA